MKQTRYRPTKECKNKLWYMHTMTISKDKFQMYYMNESQKHYAEKRNLDTEERTKNWGMVMEIRVSPKVGVAEGSRRDHLERGTYDTCICFTWEILEFREAQDMRYADTHICQTHWPVHLESVHFTVCKLESEKYF